MQFRDHWHQGCLRSLNTTKCKTHSSKKTRQVWLENTMHSKDTAHLLEGQRCRKKRGGVYTAKTGKEKMKNSEMYLWGVELGGNRGGRSNGWRAAERNQTYSWLTLLVEEGGEEAPLGKIITDATSAKEKQRGEEMTAVKDIKIRIKTASAITSESSIRIKAKRALQCLFAQQQQQILKFQPAMHNGNKKKEALFKN